MFFMCFFLCFFGVFSDFGVFRIPSDFSDFGVFSVFSIFNDFSDLSDVGEGSMLGLLVDIVTWFRMFLLVVDEDGGAVVEGAAFSFASGSWSLAGGASCVPMHRDEDRRT